MLVEVAPPEAVGVAAPLAEEAVPRVEVPALLAEVAPPEAVGVAAPLAEEAVPRVEVQTPH